MRSVGRPIRYTAATTAANMYYSYKISWIDKANFLTLKEESFYQKCNNAYEV
ncbi:hypothetical protein JZK55_07500 [Dissulfurispira thermophila]|uniref:Uncharacterized protein n=2 Tax=root TaxID=1 RepID=A0A7G1GZZ2_9BACT|nr:hypothetical protein JZK55_07500 [Dissulfurispira thermophila]